jgi:hypothetical protein
MWCAERISIEKGKVIPSIQVGGSMGQIIEITPLTLKRLLNYQRVVDNETQRAEKIQWIEMTLNKMQEYQVARQKSDHVGAVAAYAGFLFQVETGRLAYRTLYGEPFLTNALVEVLGELKIPVNLVSVPGEEAAYLH